MNESILPKGSGSRPRTTPTNPHTQLEQNPQPEMVEELAQRIFTLPGVEERPSAISCYLKDIQGCSEGVLDPLGCHPAARLSPSTTLPCTTPALTRGDRELDKRT
jgi:hypothetical protein